MAPLEIDVNKLMSYLAKYFGPPNKVMKLRRIDCGKFEFPKVAHSYN